MKQIDQIQELEQVITRKNAKETHTDDVFVTFHLNLSPFDPKINRFLGFVRNICMPSLVIIAAAVFQIFVRKKTDKHTNDGPGDNPTPATVVSVGNKCEALAYITMLLYFDVLITAN